MLWEPLSFDEIKTVSLFDRPSKVSIDNLAKKWKAGGSFLNFLDALPRILAGSDFIEALQRTLTAVRKSRVVVAGMGAHVVKVGLSPIIIQALEENIVTGIALNGAFAIHDVELALSGKTSEEVEEHLHRGFFGMVDETARFIHEAVRETVRKEPAKGLGWAVGRKIVEERLPFGDVSVLASAYLLGKPATVHVAVGTDIIHVHPLMDAAAMGELSYRDFRLFCRLITAISEGVYINIGSAVILPEVFLKAVSVAKNLGFPLENITTIDMDFQRQYRSMKNVVERPVRSTGKGFHFTGHHEIMVLLFFVLLIELLRRSEVKGCADDDHKNKNHSGID